MAQFGKYNMEKTNVMRLLDTNNIEYQTLEYDKNITDGKTIAKILNEDSNQCFKTLVTRANTNEYFVFCIPVANTLNLKKAAKAFNVKSIELILQKELLPLTGYIHGGCSPIGMKKKFPTIIDETAQLFDDIFVSAGKVGMQIKISPFKLVNFIDAKFADVCN